MVLSLKQIFIKKFKNRQNKLDYDENFIPPDGGWGWVVIVASALTNLCTVPMIQQFGLIFRDFFILNNISNSEITTITNSYQAISALAGFLIAPCFRWFSYRQIALLGSLIIVFGIYMTSYSTTFLTFLIMYSIIFGFGRGMNLAAKHIAFNVYFKKKRKRGNGIIVAITAIGPLFMSYLVLALLDNYGLKGTILILTGLAMNAFALSWAYKPIKIPKKSNETIANETNDENTTHEYQISTIKIENINLENNNIEKNKSIAVYKKIVKCFDLTLLKDLRYCNIIMGLTFSQFVESNFNVLTPFILSDFGYSYSDIALVMTVPRIPDIISRFVSPFIVERINWDNRVFWLISLFVMTLAEIIISQNPSFEIMFACFMVLGVFRGLRMIFNSIIIPGYVPLKQLPAASGLHKMILAIFMFSCGPIIGIIRDGSDNYTTAVLFLSSLSILTIILWTIDLLLQHRTNKKEKKSKEIEENKENKEESKTNENTEVQIAV